MRSRIGCGVRGHAAALGESLAWGADGASIPWVGDESPREISRKRAGCANRNWRRGNDAGHVRAMARAGLFGERVERCSACSHSWGGEVHSTSLRTSCGWSPASLARATSCPRSFDHLREVVSVLDLPFSQRPCGSVMSPHLGTRHRTSSGPRGSSTVGVEEQGLHERRCLGGSTDRIGGEAVRSTDALQCR